MGIKGLSAALKKFASQEPLQGRRVVIDGPGLAYHILWLARVEAGVSTILENPTYTVLGDTTTRWLDRLQSNGVEVAAIYFDGSLPPSKRNERHRRSCAKSGDTQSYFLRNPSGVHAKVQSRQVSRERDRFVPDPPFFVPSILETLRAHQKYGPLTHLVPGEADPYCANNVRQNGGIILTSDSDLILYDIGPTGGVVFFRDLRFDYQGDTTGTNGASAITALIYQQSTLCKRLSLDGGQSSMLQYAFQMANNRRYNNFMPPQATQASSQDACPTEYAAFAAGYQQSSNALGTTHADVGLLDPRIAEFVLDWAKLPTTETGSPAQALTVWLPFLIDRWNLESAWNMSTTIRQLAYSLCRGSEGSNCAVMEYRRTLSERSVGHAVELVNRAEALKGIEDMVSYVDRFLENGMSSQRQQWITACLGLEIGYAAQEGKESNAVDIWRRAAKSDGILDPAKWEAVHVAALMQGTLYSFRMLHQVLESLRSGTIGYLAHDQVVRLEERLSSLPSIAEFPSAMDMGVLFEQLHQSGQLSILSKVTNTLDLAFTNTEAGQGDKRRRIGERKKLKKESKPSRRPGPCLSQTSSNPFNTLINSDY